MAMRRLSRNSVELYPRPKDEWTAWFIEQWIQYDAERFTDRYGDDLTGDQAVELLLEERFKQKSQLILNDAVRDGTIKRQPCRVCDNPYVQAHHEDYSRPLDVIWLCHRCHRLLHIVYRQEEEE